MITLALDTSTLFGSVAWVRTGGGDPSSPRPPVEGYADTAARARPGHAETLIARIDETLGAGGLCLDDVDLVVYGRGPGTFTGLRLGLATAKGITLGRGVPLVGVSSLAALAL